MGIAIILGFATLVFFARIYANAKYEENTMLKKELKGAKTEMETTKSVAREYTEKEKLTVEMIKKYYWLLESYHTLGTISEDQYRKEGSWLETQLNDLDSSL